MKKQRREIKHKFWSELFDYPIIKKGGNNFWVSYPVFDLKREHAIVYIESIDGGSLVVFKKDHDSWKRFASGLIWIE